MLYRKTPRQPPRLLLRIAAAGAGAALLAACSSTGDTVHCVGCGTLAIPASDAAADGSQDTGPMGLVDSGGEPEASYDDVVVGVVVNPDAGGDAQMAGGGVMVNPDGGPMGVVDGGSD